MAGTGASLKGQNWKYILAPFVGLNVIAFLIVVTGGGDVLPPSKPALDSAAFSVGLGILALILNGQLSADLKAMLVFWRIRHPLPGCRAFSRYMHADPRLDPKTLEERFGPLPEDPAHQNRLWFRIYKGHSSDPTVTDAHRSYLATRDLAALAVLFLLIFVPVAFLLTGDRTLWAYYAGFIGVIYLLASQAARTYGQRLVTNALAAGYAASI